ncbi:MAG TPA: hypothetical protein VF657_12705 [Actinoplanes sp.]|jgi:hypothetical protein
MATLSLAVAAQPSNVPPRVMVTVTDVGAPAINAVTVTRTDNSGRVSVVRTSDGGPLPLLTSGANRVGVVYDYEAPVGVPVTYSTVEQPTVLSAEVTLASDDVWLIHPGVPERSMTVQFAAGSFGEESLPASSGVFWPLGRETAVVVTDGQRKLGGSQFTVALDTLAEVAALRALVADAGVLWLNVPPLSGFDIASQYVAILDITARRLTDIGSDPYRLYVCPFVPTQAPVGGTQAQWTWADVIATYATWAGVTAANKTWADLQAPTF